MLQFRQWQIVLAFSMFLGIWSSHSYAVTNVQISLKTDGELHVKKVDLTPGVPLYFNVYPPFGYVITSCRASSNGTVFIKKKDRAHYKYKLVFGAGLPTRTAIRFDGTLLKKSHGGGGGVPDYKPFHQKVNSKKGNIALNVSPDMLVVNEYATFKVVLTTETGDHISSIVNVNFDPGIDSVTGLHNLPLYIAKITYSWSKPGLYTVKASASGFIPNPDKYLVRVLSLAEINTKWVHIHHIEISPPKIDIHTADKGKGLKIYGDTILSTVMNYFNSNNLTQLAGKIGISAVNKLIKASAYATPFATLKAASKITFGLGQQVLINGITVQRDATITYSVDKLVYNSNEGRYVKQTVIENTTTTVDSDPGEEVGWVTALPLGQLSTRNDYMDKFNDHLNSAEVSSKTHLTDAINNLKNDLEQQYNPST